MLKLKFSNKKCKKLQRTYTISFIAIAPAIVQSPHWAPALFFQCHTHLLICTLSSRGSNQPRQVPVGNLLSTSCSSRLRPVVDRLSNLFQGFLGFSFQGESSESIIDHFQSHTANRLWGGYRADDASNCAGKIPGVVSFLLKEEKKCNNLSSFNKHYPIQANNTATVLYWDHVQKGVRQDCF